MRRVVSGKMRLLVFALLIAGLLCLNGESQTVTLAGTLTSGNAMPLANATITLTPTQWFWIAGTTTVVNTPFDCATDASGNVVAIGNPQQAPIPAAGFTGSLGAGSYYIVFAWYGPLGNLTVASPEVQQSLGSTGELLISPPASGVPSNASGMKVYIGTVSGGETLQGTTTGGATFTQSTPLSAGSAPSSTNTTLCQPYANDDGWPSYTGYTVAVLDVNGNAVPLTSNVWRLLGAGSTINLSSGLPTYNGQVIYPTPLLAQPPNHNPQSISGPLDLGNYKLTDVGYLGIDTATPAYGVDVEGAGAEGVVNAKTGLLINAGGGSGGQCLGSDGNYWDTPIACLTTATLFYQTVDSNGSAQTQRAALNFSTNFTLSDSASPARTTVDLLQLGSAATCTFPSALTYDVYGRVTGCTSASAPGGTGTREYLVAQSVCTPATSSDSDCTGTINLPIAFADTSYGVVATITAAAGGGGASPFLFLIVETKSTGSFNYTLTCTFNCSSIPAPTADIVAFHN